MSQEKYIVSKEEAKSFIDHINSIQIMKELYNLDNNGIFYKYDVIKDEIFWVYDSNTVKITSNCVDYNCGFNKTTGYTFKFGKTLEEDPQMCKLGPEILDLEISVNGCPKVGGHNCRFCYKNNSDAPATNMSFDTFKKIIDSFPKSLCQIAFGITGVKTNPDFPRMLRYCREVGIIPNYTLSGADLDDEMINVTKETCGAVAVSCYEGNKDLCYDTIKRFNTLAPNVHVNMHIVLSKGTLDHVMNVLNDACKNSMVIYKSYETGKRMFKYVTRDKRLNGLRNIVFLRIKPVGRAKNLDTTISLDIFDQVMTFCEKHNISYGFDSCTAPDVERLLRKKGREDLCSCCEACESSRFSSYINVKHEYWHCSFAERDPRISPIDVTQYDLATDWWYSDSMNEFRKSMNLKNEMDCPLFELTSKE